LPRYQNKYGAGYGPYASEDGYFNLDDINGDGVDDLTTPLKMLHTVLHLTQVY
jgi:hypothetical protein